MHCFNDDLLRPFNIRQSWIELQWVPGIYVRVVDVRWPGDTASQWMMPTFPHESAHWYARIDQWSVEPIAKVYHDTQDHAVDEVPIWQGVATGHRKVCSSIPSRDLVPN